MPRLHSAPGTYALILSSVADCVLQVGRLGQMHVRPGFYVYIGSAFGPGGVRARVSHHRESSARPHWHIDYLQAATQLEEIWSTYDPTRQEHQWAEQFKRMRGAAIPLQGFGACDCACESHLYFFSTRPSPPAFHRGIRNLLPGHGLVHVHHAHPYASSRACQVTRLSHMSGKGAGKNGGGKRGRASRA